MTFGPHIRIAIAAVSCAVVAAPAAFGAGEPKNEPPFTRQVGDLVERDRAAATSADPAGEPKNEPPFTRQVGGLVERDRAAATSADPAGEPKNEAPFVREISRTPVLVETQDGFDWADAGIGAAAVLGLSSVALGALVLRRGGRPRATGA
jgi:hypothetical protein